MKTFGVSAAIDRLEQIQEELLKLQKSMEQLEKSERGNGATAKRDRRTKAKPALRGVRALMK